MRIVGRCSQIVVDFDRRTCGIAANFIPTAVFFPEYNERFDVDIQSDEFLTFIVHVFQVACKSRK